MNGNRLFMSIASFWVSMFLVTVKRRVRKKQVEKAQEKQHAQGVVCQNASLDKQPTKSMVCQDGFINAVHIVHDRKDISIPVEVGKSFKVLGLQIEQVKSGEGELGEGVRNVAGQSW